MCKRFSGMALAVVGALALGLGPGRSYLRVALADEPPPAEKPAQDAASSRYAMPTAWTTAVDPKPLTAGVKKGLDWLVEHQHPGGGWSQGEESPNMRGAGGSDSFRDSPDVADTCIAALALIRSGSTPRDGPYHEPLAKAVGYIRKEVQGSDTKSLFVSDVRGTRVQQKLGPTVDTFLASLLLAEVKGRMPDDTGNKAVDLALTKVLDKIKRNQKADGTWDNATGWAPVLAQGIGGKGLNRAAQAGAEVSSEVLARASSFAAGQAQASAGRAGKPMMVAAAEASRTGPTTQSAGGVAARSVTRRRAMGAGMGGMAMMGAGGAGSAGVELYDRASSLSVLQDSVNTFATREKDLRDKAKNGTTARERKQATVELSRIGETRKSHVEAQKALLGRLDDAQFVAGFGSNGGEEFLSYMNISESLVVKGGRDWKRWDDAMTTNLGRVQNDDGSWSGNHCITGRTFCTSTALLVLMADRTPVPISATRPSTPAEK